MIEMDTIQSQITQSNKIIYYNTISLHMSEFKTLEKNEDVFKVLFFLLKMP